MPGADVRSDRVTLRPGEFWSGSRRSICDGLVVVMHLRRTEHRLEQIEGLVIHEIHDFNAPRRRTQDELREHVLQCIRTFEREGVMIRRGDDRTLVRPRNVTIAPNLRIHLFTQPEPAEGPWMLSVQLEEEAGEDG